MRSSGLLLVADGVGIVTTAGSFSYRRRREDDGGEKMGEKKGRRREREGERDRFASPGFLVFCPFLGNLRCSVV